MYSQFEVSFWKLARISTLESAEIFSFSPQSLNFQKGMLNYILILIWGSKFPLIYPSNLNIFGIREKIIKWVMNILRSNGVVEIFMPYSHAVSFEVQPQPRNLYNMTCVKRDFGFPWTRLYCSKDGWSAVEINFPTTFSFSCLPLAHEPTSWTNLVLA